MKQTVLIGVLGLSLGIAGCTAGGGGRASGETAEESPAAAEVQSTPRVARPAIVSAQAWGSTPQTLGDDRLHEPKYVTIHHAGVTWTAGGDAAQKIKNLQAWGQKEKGWPDLPYHYLIAPDGTIYEGRPPQYEPETNTNYEVAGHLGIQVYGNFEEQRISPAQMASLVHLTAWLLDEYGFETDVIGGHKDRPGADTSCPGKDLDRYLLDGSFVGWVEATRQGEAPAIDLGPALPDGPTQMIPDAG